MTTTLTKLEQLWRGKREIQVGDWGISYIGRLPVSETPNLFDQNIHNSKQSHEKVCSWKVHP